MARYIFKLPDVGEGTAEAELVAWHVKVGDEVEEDQPIVEVMTDKATVEIPAPVAGKVISVSGSPGEMLAVGSDILVLEVAGEGNGPADKPAAASPPSAEPPRANTPPPPPAPPVAAPVATVGPVQDRRQPPAKAQGGRAPAFATRTDGERPIASPAVQRKAWELGIELQFVPGSGPGGRITHDDLAAYVASGGKSAVVSRGLVEKHG